ncbi:MAG: PAS domain S-box protein [Spirochaetaceae bacterium]|nr:MAG: PAS domain S-box protein [Spirochaetaceae bacterium]
MAKQVILLVEDELLIATAERMVLERAGYEVITASTGERALEIARDGPEIDLVLMDINLGTGIDGTEAARIILRDRDLPLVFLSSHTDPETIAKTEKITSYGYVVKNSGETILLASIRMAFRLHESRRVISDTFTYSINGVCVHRMLYDDSGTPFDCEYLSVNEAFERHSGLSGPDIIGRTIREIFPEAEAAPVVKLYADILGGREAPRQEIHFPPLRAWFEMNLFATRDEEFTVIVSNITASKEAEAALAESEERYRTLFETITQGIVHQDTEGTILSVNPAAERILGLPLERVQGRKVLSPQWDIIGEEGSPLPEEDHPAMRALRTGETVGPINLGLFHPHRNERMWLRITAIPLFRPGEEKPFQAYAVFEETRNERKADQRYRLLFDSIRDAIVVADENRLISSCNPAFAELFGYTPAEVKGRSSEMLYPTTEEYHRVGRAIRALRGDAGSVVETRFRRKDGQEFAGEKRMQPLYDESGHECGFIGIIRDVTERKAAEDQIQQLLREKETLLREVQHRVKNNMNTMTSMLSLQAETLRDPGAIEALTAIRGRFRSLEVLYDQLYRRESHDTGSVKDFLSQLLNSILQLYPHGPDVTVSINLEERIAEARQLSTLGIIVNELLTNAMKYAFQEHPEPRLSLVGRKNDGRYTITLSDNGIGPQASFDTTSSTGFGMTLVSALTEQLNGSIRFEQDGGTRVTLDVTLDHPREQDQARPGSNDETLDT